jgi:hypothetical protein
VEGKIMDDKNIHMDNEEKSYLNDPEMRKNYINMIKETICKHELKLVAHEDGFKKASIFGHESKLLDHECGIKLARISLTEWKKHLENVEAGIED